MSDGLDDIINETTSQRTLAPVAVASQVGLMLGISVSLLSGCAGHSVGVDICVPRCGLVFDCFHFQRPPPEE